MTGKLEVLRYFAVDGGVGAPLLAGLSHVDSFLVRVDSPRHANLLLVFEPLSPKLAPAVLDAARALPRPSRALLVRPACPPYAVGEARPAEELLPGAARCEATRPQAFARALRAAPATAVLALPEPPPQQPAELEPPPREDQEMASELLLWSVGPLQRLTAGPMELLLACDGEQVVKARVERGYARRGLFEAMLRLSWREAAEVARQWDPLAPVASQLVYVRALESLRQEAPPAQVEQAREAALALERASNHLLWVERFASFLGMAHEEARARALRHALDGLCEALWRPLPVFEWLAPRARPGPMERTVLERLVLQVGEARSLARHIRSSRPLRLRIRGLGRVGREELEVCGVTGPVLIASTEDTGDIQARLHTRLDAIAPDMAGAVERLMGLEPEAARQGVWEGPRGIARATVQGPRGELGLLLEAQGGPGPSRVEWASPSAALLRVVPSLLEGARVADAELTLASLDLCMAEADG